jgi:hypothetical protein
MGFQMSLTSSLFVQSLSVVPLVQLVSCCSPNDKYPMSELLTVGASNIYLGLKTGFTFGPQLFGVGHPVVQ